MPKASLIVRVTPPEVTVAEASVTVVGLVRTKLTGAAIAVDPQARTDKVTPATLTNENLEAMAKMDFTSS